MQNETGGDGPSAVEESDGASYCHEVWGIYTVRKEELDNTGSSLPGQPFAACGTAATTPWSTPARLPTMMQK